MSKSNILSFKFDLVLVTHSLQRLRFRVIFFQRTIKNGLTSPANDKFTMN